jgi:hypothetical protein
MMRRDEATHRTAAGIVAGLVAGVAFIVAMAGDITITRYRSNDLRLVSGLVPGLGGLWPVLGTAIHIVNGAALGALYAHVEDRIHGPGWFKGVVFGLIENAVLWPIIMLLDQVHPDIRAGRLPKFNRATPFLQEVFRHVVYGAVLGWTYEQLRR